MKINPVSNNNIIPKAYKVTPLTPQERPNMGADEVSFSEEVMTFSSTINKIKESLELRSPEEQKHLDAIKVKIANGTYQVSSEEIAEKMINDYIAGPKR